MKTPKTSNLTDFSDHSEDPRPPLDHEGLDVYRVALDFAVYGEDVAASLPKEAVHLQSQLRRSSSSVPLNIAEACGWTTPAERSRARVIARGSATESAATLDVLHRIGRLQPGRFSEGKTMARRIVSMLTAMIRSNGVRTLR
jgi:four helix bundle protein